MEWIFTAPDLTKAGLNRSAHLYIHRDKWFLILKMRAPFALLTLMAMMQSMVLSLRTQAIVGALSERAIHFSYSFSDLTHHLTLSGGTANTAPAKLGCTNTVNRRKDIACISWKEINSYQFSHAFKMCCLPRHPSSVRRRRVRMLNGGESRPEERCPGPRAAFYRPHCDLEKKKLKKSSHRCPKMRVHGRSCACSHPRSDKTPTSHRMEIHRMSNSLNIVCINV